MKDALVAQKRFLFGGAILAIGALFYAQKSIGRELIASGLARLATAEELQANGGLNEAIDEAGEAETEAEPEQAEQPEPETNQPADEAGEAETEQEAGHADASSDAPASEEPPAPVPARRGRKSAS